MSDNQSDNAPEWGRVLHAAARRSATLVPDPKDARIAELERDRREQSLRYVSLWGEFQALVEERDALRSRWMPIESAPKDVTILLYGAKRLEMCVGMHHSRDGWVTDTTSEWASMYPPTHWMPLPSAPGSDPQPDPRDAELARLRSELAEARRDAQPRLTVRLVSFPESNGKRNWTALLVRADKWDGLIGNCGGVSLARGELWNRVAYHAECARLLIGERDTEPFILDYGDDIETPEQWKGETSRAAMQGKP